MNIGLSTLLTHRGRTSTTQKETTNKQYTRLIMDDQSTIICFDVAVKKSDIASLIEEQPETNTIVTGPTISRPAGLLAIDNGIEFINSGLYAFDLLRSSRVPQYDRMDTKTILSMEESLKCPRNRWPTLRSDDPIALYMGFLPGTCLQVRSGFYQQNVRRVVKV